MKTKLILISLIGSLALADVTVTESARVLVDGKDIGDVASAVKNGIATPSEVQAALEAMLANLSTEKAAAAAARLTVITDTKTALAEADASKAKAAALAAIAVAEVPEIEKKKAQLDAEIAAKQAERAKLNK